MSFDFETGLDRASEKMQLRVTETTGVGETNQQRYRVNRSVTSSSNKMAQGKSNTIKFRDFTLKRKHEIDKFIFDCVFAMIV